MKQWTVTSLSLFIILLIYVSCDTNNNGHDLSIQHQKHLDSLNTYYDVASNKSNGSEEKLEALSRFIKGSEELGLDSLQYKGLILQTKLLNKYGDTEKAIEQSNILLKIATKNKDSILIGRAYYKLGIYNKSLDKSLEGFDFLNQSFKIRRNIKDSINAGKSLMAMSNVQRILGDYNASKTTATDGLTYIENSSEYRLISGLYQNISIAFYELKNYKEALVWNDKIMHLLNDSVARNDIRLTNIPIFKNTRATILSEQKKYQESIAILKTVLSDKEFAEDTRRYPMILSNLAYIKFLENPDNPESENMFLEALRIREEEEDEFGIYRTNVDISRYYKYKDIEKARYHAYEAYEYVKGSGDYEALIEILTHITALDPESLEHHQCFKDASLKLIQLREKTREIYAPTRFENENLLKENEEKNRKIAKVRNQNTIFLLGILLLLISIGFAVYFFRQRTKYLSQQNKIVQFQASYETETRISKRLHDELGNDIFQVMLQYQNDPHDPNIKEKLNSTYNKARDISRENNEFDTEETYAEELHNMLENYAKNGIRLIVIGFKNIPWSHFDKTVKITVYRVLQELMTNMQKHSKASLVKLVFSNAVDTLKITYSDNGVGMVKEHITSKNGLRNTEKRIQAIEGTLIFDAEKDKGFKAEIQIPN
ncbi:ATP-binding protein [Aquimarina sp. 2201CG1-2-11]|uniref:sensor histidine kinase n=1 Tax=Aquimarina discodermiae TaxID=3231043 RepID=UPI0034618EE6